MCYTSMRIERKDEGVYVGAGGGLAQGAVGEVLVEPQERAGNGLPEGRVATRGLELLRRAEQARSAVRAAVEAFFKVLLVLQIGTAREGEVRMGGSKDADSRSN
jgi:hypothetical protein